MVHRHTTDPGRSTGWPARIWRLAVLAAALAVSAGPLGAASIVVTTTVDGIASDGECTLREAIRAANLNVAVDACVRGDAAPAVDLVVLTESETPYLLTAAGAGDDLGDLDVFSSLEIGGAPSTIDASALGDRAFDVRGGVEAVFVLVHVRGGDAGSFRGGGIRAGSGSVVKLFESSVRGSHAWSGAGIAASGGATVALRSSEVSHNGGLHAIDLASATLVLAESTVASNQGAGVSAVASSITATDSLLAANTMSGLRAAGASNVVVRNTTLSGNGHPDHPGGGLRIEGPAAANLYYATVTENWASSGGGVHVTGSLTIKGSILGANHAPVHPDCYSESAQMTSEGRNLLHREDCGITPQSTDIVGAAPALDLLADWGGATRSHRLLLGSPALDAGASSDFPAFDQRGEPRPRDGDTTSGARADIGAHENANTIVVNSGADLASATGDCGLRDALRSADTDTAVDGCRPGFERDLIWIDPAAVGDVRLAIAGGDDAGMVGDLDVRQDVDVAGLPARPALIDGRFVDRVFDVQAPALLGLSHLDVKNGARTGAPGGGIRVLAGAFATVDDVGFENNGAWQGGGAWVAGELRGDGVWLHHNTASDSGGGIAVAGSGASVKLARASVTDNEATQADGGGVAVLAGGARLDDSTVAGNRAAGHGGGVFTAGRLELHGATVAFNRADSDSAGGGQGGGIHAPTGGADLMNSIVAENQGPGADCGGELRSGGYNLIGEATCAFVAATGDQTGVEVDFGMPIGGAYTLRSSSPARDAGSPEMTGTLGTSCSARDGLGSARPADGDGDGDARCDAGAVESMGSGILDVDADGAVLPLTDSQLVLHHLFGLTGASLVADAVGAGAERSSAVAIAAYVESIEGLLDVDGNGITEPLTDGLLILRYLLELDGAALTGGAIGPGAVRTTSAQIVAYLDQLASG
jgi:CSLREA domain-containing protein